MRRRVVTLLVGAGLAVGLGAVVWAGSQGFIGFGGANRLLAQANRAIQHQDWAAAQAKLEELVGTHPDSAAADDGLLKLGQVYEQQDQLVEARATYRLLLTKFPNSPLAAQAQERLGTVNVALLFSRAKTAADVTHEVKPGDTLGKIAQQYGTTIALIKKANGLASDVIRAKQMLKIPQGRFSIVVDKSQNRLLVTENDQFFKMYTVATGKDNSTPVGAFKITTKLEHPVWYKEGAVVPANSPENILGTRWMGLDKPGYGIHGSVDPSDMGKQVTAGCIRMRNEDVEELYAIVSPGTSVTIVD